MGLILQPSEIKNGVKQINANIASARDNYQGALQVIKSFSENTALQSKAWGAAKSTVFEAHQAIIQGMSVAQDVVLRQADELNELSGDTYLSEDELASRIQMLIEECTYYEEAIRNLEMICANSIYWNSLGYSKMIENYKALLEKTREELEILEGLLEDLREKGNLSAQLFEEAVPLLQEIEKAINDAEFYINGTGELSDGSWKIAISTLINDLNGAKMVTSLSEKGYDFLVRLELGDDWKEAEFIKTDDQGNIVAIRNHDVGDGGITVGVGIFVNESNAERIKMLESLDITWNDTKQWVPYDKITQAFNNISGKYREMVDKAIKTYNLTVTQEQYDALFLMAYNRPNFFSDGGAVNAMLASKNDNIDDWRNALLNEYKSTKNWDIYKNGWTNRVEDQLELYFKGDYVKNHG